VSLQAGLPDGILSNQISQFGKILSGLRVEKVGRYTYSSAIWNILRPFSTFYGHWVIKLQNSTYIFSRFGIFCQENLATLLTSLCEFIEWAPGRVKPEFSRANAFVQTVLGAEEGESAGQQDVEQDPRRPDVDRLPVRLPLDHFRCHEVRGPDPGVDFMNLHWP
jgi:hypothetical protein